MVKQTPASTEALIASTARLLGDYIQSGRMRTDLLKECAAVVAELRQHFHLADGRTDWGGRSPAYRKAMHEAYSRAHVPTDRFDTVQAALRYHVGNLLREIVPADELAAAGLSKISPKERLNRTRDVVAALSMSGSVAEITGDPIRLLIYAEALIDHVAEDALDGLKGKERVAARDALRGLAERIEELLPHLPAQRSTRKKAV